MNEVLSFHDLTARKGKVTWTDNSSHVGTKADKHILMEAQRKKWKTQPRDGREDFSWQETTQEWVTQDRREAATLPHSPSSIQHLPSAMISVLCNYKIKGFYVQYSYFPQNNNVNNEVFFPSDTEFFFPSVF